LTSRSILFLVPNLLGSPGGITRHGRMVCQALAGGNVRLAIVALHDPAEARGDGLGTFAMLDYHGCNSRRSMFIWQALLASRRRPSLVLVEHPNFSPLGWFCARLTRAHLAVFGHGVDIWNPLPRLRRWALQRADRVICVSRLTARRAMSFNQLPSSKVSVLYNCLDPALHLHATPTWGNERQSLLTVARLSTSEGYKGHDLVIRALPALLGRFPNLIYDVVGDGDGRPALEQLATSMGVRHAVRFHGIVSEDELSSYYADTCLFVMPSQGEGFGFTFLEAMAHGKPVIAGNGDAASEIIRHGETGLLVDPSDLRALTNAITQLLADPRTRHTMGARGAALVAQEFSFDSFQSRLHSLLDEVLDPGDLVSATAL
jgi:phosphatidyl-myo-inositol dimannoside synthase